MIKKPKIFDDLKLNKAELRKVMCLLAKRLGVKKVVFNRKAKRVRGTYNCFKQVIYIDTKQTKRDMLLTFFHEMGHHYAIKRNLWLSYHLCTVESMAVEKIFLIENKVDKIGKSLWNKYVNHKQWGKYRYVYPKSQKTAIMNTITNS